MSLSIKQIIELRGPEFASDTRIDDLITLAKTNTGTEFGDSYNQAVALRVLHWLSREKQGGGSSSNSGSASAGRILSEREGQLAVTYQQSNNSQHEDLTSTRFGSELVDLMKGCLFLPRTRIGTNELTPESPWFF